MNCSGISGVILLLMICATIYECRVNEDESDVESSTTASNNNERFSNFADRNLTEDRGVSIVQDNGKELIEKVLDKDGKRDMKKIQRMERKSKYYIL